MSHTAILMNYNWSHIFTFTQIFDQARIVDIKNEVTLNVVTSMLYESFINRIGNILHVIHEYRQSLDYEYLY